MHFLVCMWVREFLGGVCFFLPNIGSRAQIQVFIRHVRKTIYVLSHLAGPEYLVVWLIYCNGRKLGSIHRDMVLVKKLKVLNFDLTAARKNSHGHQEEGLIALPHSDTLSSKKPKHILKVTPPYNGTPWDKHIQTTKQVVFSWTLSRLALTTWNLFLKPVLIHTQKNVRKEKRKERNKEGRKKEKGGRKEKNKLQGSGPSFSSC